jgi:hypothetical protein
MNNVKLDMHKTTKSMAYVYIDTRYDKTIYLYNNLKSWAEYEMTQDIIDVMTSTLSHESLHIVLDIIGQQRASTMIDILFGRGDQHKEEYNGLCKFNEKFRPTPKSRRLKGW